MTIKHSAEARLRDALLNAGVLNPETLIDGFYREVRNEALMDAQQIVAGEHQIEDEREHSSMVATGYLIRELDEEILDNMKENK